MWITQAILSVRAKYAAEFKLSPYEINNGQCMNFAADIARMGYGEDIWGNELDYDNFWSDEIRALISDDIDAFYNFAAIHCFIMYEGKFYDSETPQGCDYADNLLCYQRNIDLLIED